MRRILLVLLVVMVVMGLVVVPASAKKPLIGQQELYFNLDAFSPFEYQVCPGLAWYGKITFGEDEFGLAYVSSMAPKTKGETLHFADFWIIYEDSFDFQGPAPPVGFCETLPGFEPLGFPIGERLVMGVDKGKQANATLRSVANGKVNFVMEGHDFFGEELMGRNVHWSGVTNMSDFPITFAGPFRFN
jgi:hypothetical protein